MNLRNTLALILLSMCMHGAIIGMEGKKSFFLIPMTDSGKYAQKVVKYINTGDNDIIWEIGKWFTKKRVALSENDGWQEFMKQFLTDIDTLKPMCDTSLKKVQLEGIKEVIREITKSLKPGQDCAPLLHDRTEELVIKVAKY